MALALCSLYDRLTGSKPPSALPPSTPSSSSISSPVSWGDSQLRPDQLRKRTVRPDAEGGLVLRRRFQESPQSFGQRVRSLASVAKTSFQSSYRRLYSCDWSGYASKLRDATCYIGRGIKSLCLKIDSLVEKYIGGQD